MPHKMPHKLLLAICALSFCVEPLPAKPVSKAAPKVTQAKAVPIKSKTTKTKAAKSAAAKSQSLTFPDSRIEPLAWNALAGWQDDHHAEAFATFLASCKAILKSTPKQRTERGPAYAALYSVCTRAMAAVPLDDDGARLFFERNFRPLRLSGLAEGSGFFTGYYEPIVEGARQPSETYQVPLYRAPPTLAAKQQTKRGRKAKAPAPFYDREQIEKGALKGQGLEIVYLKNPVDAFFAEIQGSLRVRLEDGSIIRLNYAAKNGHPYTPVGRFLIDREIFTREEISMQKIREYMEANPEEGQKLRWQNKSYVFFREADLSEYEEAIGAQGLPLSAARSIAVDRKLHTYGMPVFVDVTLPIRSEQPDTRFQRLMIAQDTGGAIIGSARADIYLGAGEDAARAAGRFRHPGQFVMLVPNELDPARSAPPVPLPLPRLQQDVAANNAAAGAEAGASSAARKSGAQNNK